MSANPFNVFPTRCTDRHGLTLKSQRQYAAGAQHRTEFFEGVDVQVRVTGFGRRRRYPPTVACDDFRRRHSQLVADPLCCCWIEADGNLLEVTGCEQGLNFGVATVCVGVVLRRSNVPVSEDDLRIGRVERQ
jgi:hypothetical protein